MLQDTLLGTAEENTIPETIVGARGYDDGTEGPEGYQPRYTIEEPVQGQERLF